MTISGPSKPLPPPLKPLRGRATVRPRATHQTLRKSATAPDWELWPGSRRVTRDEAIALTFGIDPECLEYDSRGHIIPESLPDETTEKIFRKRLRSLEACRPYTNILLSEIATWAVWEVKLKDLPFEFAALAQKPDKAAHMPAWPWGTHNTKLLSKLKGAAEKFWKNYDPTDATTAPKSTDLIVFLKKEGVSTRIAESMATILRADRLPTGPRK
jgi:hypothetical protein